MSQQAQEILTKVKTDTQTRMDIGEFIKLSSAPVLIVEICSHLGWDYTESSRRKIRRHVELLVSSGMALQSADTGYSVITSVEQLNEARKRFKNNAIAAWKRYNQLQVNFYSGKVGRQLTFEEFLKEEI